MSKPYGTCAMLEEYGEGGWVRSVGVDPEAELVLLQHLPGGEGCRRAHPLHSAAEGAPAEGAPADAGAGPARPPPWQNHRQMCNSNNVHASAPKGARGAACGCPAVQ